MSLTGAKYSRPIIIAMAVTTLCSGVGIYAWKENKREPLLEVYVFELRTGRSMFIRTPDDTRILVDGGGNSEIVRHLSKILPFYSRYIDIAIVTNSDGKNVSGLIDVLDRYNIGKVHLPRFTIENIGLASSSDHIYETLVETIDKKGIEKAQLIAGDILRPSPGVEIQVIFPVKTEEFSYSKASSPELLFRIKYGSNSVVFMGDSSKKIQKFVASTFGQMVKNSNALIVSHSAVPGNISNEFVREVGAKYLIYKKAVSKNSASSNNKKSSLDPLAAVLRENRFNLKVIGSVLITSDGNNLDIKKAP